MRLLALNAILVTVAAGLVVGYGVLFAAEKLAERLGHKLTNGSRS
jgi:hypothetical protein